MTDATPLGHRLDGPTGRPVILYLHGFLGRGGDWHPVIDRIGRDFSHLTVDLPGHGETGAHLPPEGWSLAGCADLLAGLLDRLGIGPVTLIGYSMGGRLAWHLLLAHPALISRAVVVSAHPGLPDDDARRQRRSQDEATARRLETLPPDDFLREWYARPLFAPLVSSVGMDALLERRRRNDPLLLARALRAFGLGTQPDLADRIRASAVRQLLVTGRLDDAYTRRAATLAGGSGAIGHVAVDGCGHAPHLEDPDAFTAAVLSWLRPPS